MNNYVKQQLAAQETSAQFPYLIKITHDDYPPLYYANSTENITYEGDIYERSFFKITPPEREGAKIGNASLTISAVDQYWITKIRETQKPARIQFIAAIIYDDDNVMGIERLEENSFTLRNVNWNEVSIQWEMIFDDRMDIVITGTKCTPFITPGLT